MAIGLGFLNTAVGYAALIDGISLHCVLNWCVITPKYDACSYRASAREVCFFLTKHSIATLSSNFNFNAAVSEQWAAQHR